VHEAVHNISRVRNAGASAARGDVLAFVDADTIVPPNFLGRVAEAMGDPACFGGSADIVHTPASKLLRAYLDARRWLGIRLDMAQGAAQFCRRSAFDLLKGDDELYFMGEDVDFYWRLQKLYTKAGGHLSFLNDVKVVPSPRRFDLTPHMTHIDLNESPVHRTVSKNVFSLGRMVRQNPALAPGPSLTARGRSERSTYRSVGKLATTRLIAVIRTDRLLGQGVLLTVVVRILDRCWLMKSMRRKWLRKG
jgi:glycosyltransferase involved in cell wall biosynthesis